jgi:TonB family protein
MNSFIEYIIKSGISLTVLYLLYWLLLRNNTHFRLNRALLLFSLVFSAVMPLIRFDILPVPLTQSGLPDFAVNFSEPAASSSPEFAKASSKVFDVRKIIVLIYIAGMCIACARLIYQAIYLQAISRLSDKQKKDGFTLVSMNTDMVPFSYFKRIYLPTLKVDEHAVGSIINHEKSHLTQHHYLDLFIIEMMSVFHWFNPVVWFYEKSLKEIHEYLADEAVLHTGENAGKYQAILVNQAMGGPVFVFTNQFNQSLIKKRIIMMNKLKSPRWSQLKALLVVPLAAGLLVAFASPQTAAQSSPGGKQITVTGLVTEKNTGEGIPGSAVIIQGTTTGTLTDRDGNYSIEVNNPNAILVFSFVGYKTQAIPVGNNTKINVEFETEVLALDFDKGNQMAAPCGDDQKSKQKAGTGAENEEMYVAVETNPSYPGGTWALAKFLRSNLRYPEAAKGNRIEGIVLVQYTIDAKGAVKDARVMRGLTPELDAEALRVTNLITGWKPGTQNGKSIKRVVSMPVQFILP